MRRALRGKILRIRPQPDGTYTIPEGNLSLREAFFTRNAEGNGLGLSIAQQIATAHDTRIELLPKAEPEGGAHFRLLLPRDAA